MSKDLFQNPIFSFQLLGEEAGKFQKKEHLCVAFTGAGRKT